MVDQAITGLTEDLTPSLTDLMETVKDPGGTPLSRKAQIGNVLKLLQGNIIYLTNNDGVAHYAGTVVIVDTSLDNGCKKTTNLGDPKVIGIAAETVAAGASGKYYQLGQATVLVQGNVSRGAWLIASTTSGRAAQYGFLKPASGGIGIALTAYAGGGAGTVTALISIQLSSTAPLQQLATATPYTATGTSISTSHTTDSGTDLLVVRIANATGAAPTSVTFNGTGLTKHPNDYVGGTYCTSIWYLRLPSIGTYTLTVNIASSSAIDLYATNYAGSQSTPFRTGLNQGGASLTSVSQTPTSAVGDIVIDSLLNNSISDWTVTAGQTTEILHRAASTWYHSASYKAGTAGSTTMAWSGSTANTGYVTAAIAGS